MAANKKLNIGAQRAVDAAARKKESYAIERAVQDRQIEQQRIAKAMQGAAGRLATFHLKPMIETGGYVMLDNGIGCIMYGNPDLPVGGWRYDSTSYTDCMRFVQGLN